MLDFICPICGHFDLENEACASCDSVAAQDLVA